MFFIRQAHVADAEAIAAIHVTTWKNTYYDLLYEKDLSNMTYDNRKTLWETVLGMKKKDQCTFVILDDEKVVGFVSGGPERTKRFRFDAEIYTIYVLPAYQKTGLGTRLLHVFAEKMKALDCSSLLVWILKKNPASRFYERYRAKPVGVEETTIGKGTYQETAFGWENIETLLEQL